MTTIRRGFLTGAGVARAALAATGTHVISQAAEAQCSLGGRGLKISELSLDHYKIRRNPIEGPNKARIAVTSVINFEGKIGATNSFDIAYTDYSCKAGMWSLLKIFQDNNVRGT